MRDEERFPTVKFRTCPGCGSVYTGSLTGEDTCPTCRAPYRQEDISAEGIEREGENGHVVITLHGPIRKLGQLDALRSLIDSASQGDARSVAFVLEGTSYLGSSLVNLLVLAMRSLAAAGRPTYIVASDPEVLESLRMLDLDRVIRIFPDRKAYRAARDVPGS